MTVEFRKTTADDLKRLEDIVGSEDLLTGGELLEDYCHDEMYRVRGIPEAVVFPENTEEVSAVMKYCWEHDVPVTPRGSGTGLCGGAVPVRGGIVLCTSKMDKFLEIDPETFTATVESGVMLMTIHEKCEKQGFLYAPDPGEKTASIGGNINTNAGGMRAIKYGVTRDNVRGLEVVLPDGTVMRTGGKQAKNSTGYGLLHTFVGSEGTLGVVTKAILKLLPLPKVTMSLLIPFSSLKDAISAVPVLMRTGVTPQSVEFAELEVIKAAEEYLGKQFPHRSSPAYLLVRVDGNTPGEVEGTVNILGDAALAQGAEDVLIADTPERQSAIWDTRGAFLSAIKTGQDIEECDVVVPRTKIPDLVEFSKVVSDKIGVRILSFGHAGDGNLHIYVLRDNLDAGAWEEKLEKAMEMLYQKGFELGGLTSGEHGIGYAKRTYMRRNVDKAAYELMRHLKASLDPKGLLNPDKVV